MVNYIVLGATGSIGSQTLDIIRKNGDKLVAFSYGNKLDVALKIIEEFKPLYVACKNESHRNKIKEQFSDITVYTGSTGNNIIASLYPDNSIVVNALVGSIGLEPTVNAIKTKHDVLIANKETLVIGGSIVMPLVKEYGVKLIPIDSEHSAIYQLLVGHNKEEVNKIIITASGGSFRNKTKEELENVTVEEALKHPNWVMGPKITIDSATLMNKGFEIIEAYHLFNLTLGQIETIIHPESIIHSMVEFKDHSVFAQLGNSDMHLPINYALNGPLHNECDIIEPLDFTKISSLHFEKLDLEKHKLVAYAYEAIRRGGYYPTILNASNEAAVELFLNRKIKFLDIEKIIINEFENTEYQKLDQNISVESIIKLDKEIKEKIKKLYL